MRVMEGTAMSYISNHGVRSYSSATTECWVCETEIPVDSDYLNACEECRQPTCGSCFVEERGMCSVCVQEMI